jgi:hypothetical protein
MFSALWAILYRDRRRLGFVALMAYLAGFLFYLPHGIWLGAVPLPVVTGAVYAFVVGLVTLLVCALFPALRFMIEAVAVSRLVLSFAFLAAPQFGAAVLASPLFTALLVVGGGALVSRLLHGRILRERRPGWRALLGPANLFHRTPPRLRGHVWQHRFTGWLDDAEPIPA